MQPVDEGRFRAAMGGFATGVCVVAVRDAHGAPIGFTASSLASVSLEPPLILFCVGRDASIAPLFAPGRPFGVSVLRADQGAVSEAFASDPTAWFAANGSASGPGGGTLLPERLAALDCTVERVDDGGDHLIVLGRVLHAASDAGAEPLLHFRGRYRTLGP